MNRGIARMAQAILAILLFSACGGGSGDEAEPVIVSFKDKSLTPSLLKRYIPQGVSSEDSARYADKFIEQWVKEQAVMDYALSQDETLSEEVEFKVQDYRAKLIMNAYEARLVEKEMDKEVLPQEIRNYYEANKDNFRSKEEMYCYFYLVTTERDLGEVSGWMRSDGSSELSQLRDWSEKNTLTFKLDSTYVTATQVNDVSEGYFGDLKKASIGKLIRWNGVIQGERRRYLFKMVDVVGEGGYLPVSLCADRIRELLLNERKIELIESTEEKILSNARASNYIRNK